jgi:hypothetical protein
MICPYIQHNVCFLLTTPVIAYVIQVGDVLLKINQRLLLIVKIK